jgi:hypothetical protein
VELFQGSPLKITRFRWPKSWWNGTIVVTATTLISRGF